MASDAAMAGDAHSCGWRCFSCRAGMAGGAQQSDRSQLLLLVQNYLASQTGMAGGAQRIDLDECTRCFSLSRSLSYF
eukprot:1158505-Pelagomonas_calceolata.AAC.2